MQISFQNNNSDELIILLNGWGMDERPYKLLKSKRDILFVSNYSTLDFTQEFLEFDFTKYSKIFLITFSAGAFMANYLQDKLPKFDLKIAVGGSFYLFDSERGVPPDVHKSMQNISLENALDFRKNLVDNEKDYNLFNKNQPLRDLESSLSELSALEKYYAENKPITFKFDKVIIGNNDKIIPPLNQLRVWADIANAKTIKGGHFLFYEFDDFEEIINF